MKKYLLIIVYLMMIRNNYSQIIFSEPFTSNLGQMIAANGSNGNWVYNANCSRSNLTGHTGPGSANYIGSGCTFGNGGSTVSGNLTSPTILIPSVGAVLSFNYALATECGTSGTCTYDILTLQISNNGGLTYTNVAASNGSPLAINANTGWSTYTLSLNTYSNQSILIRYNFNTLDGVLNAYDGVYIDDITVTSNCTPPTVNVVASATSVCNGGSVNLTASGATTYTWLPSNLNTANITVTPSSNTTYTVIGKTGCTTTKTISVQVGAIPLVSVAISSSVTCNGFPVTFTGSGAATYTLLPTNSVGSVITVTPPASMTYTLLGKSSAGCQGSNTVNVNVYVIPTVSITASNSVICTGDMLNLSASGASTYTWFPGSLVGSSINVSPTVNTNYYAVGTSPFGCLGNASISIVVNSLPVIGISALSNSICEGNSIQMNASGAVTYTWMPLNSNAASVSVSPVSSTIYTVTGTSSLACVSSNTFALLVNQNPTVSITASANPICLGDNTLLSATGAQSYTWLPTNTNSATLLVAPTSNTVFSVIGSNASGCTASNTIALNVNQLPQLNVATSNSAICLGDSSMISVSGAQTYTWMPLNLNSTSVTVYPSTTTNYTVAGTSGAGCSNSAVVSILVYSLPNISASASSSTICSGDSLTLSANGALTYTWLPLNVMSSSTIVAPSVTTNYTVIGTSLNGCVASDMVNVLVNTTPVLSLSATSSSICIGDTTVLSVTGANSYVWLPLNSSNSSINVAPSNSITYTVQGTAINGCTSTDSIMITVNPLPIIVVTTNEDTLCVGSFVNMNASGAVSYTWSPINLNTPSVSASPASNTIYTVTGVSAFGCVNTSTIIVVVNPIPLINVSSASVSTCSGDSVSLSANGAASYTWMPGSINGSNATVLPLTNVIYTVTGTSLNGCSATNTIDVEIKQNPVISITSSSEMICKGTSATLTATGAITYTWSIINQNSSTVSVAPSITTIYTVTGTGANGCNATAQITQTVSECTGLKEVAVDQIVFRVYPNPNKGTFTIKLNSFSSQTEFQIYNLLGQQVAAKQVEQTEEVLSLNVAKGIYFVQVTEKDKVVQVSKVIIQ